MKNECGKTRDVNNPYEVWKCRMNFGVEGGFDDILEIEYRVLKKYQSPKGEAENPFARWFTAAKSEATYGSWEYGDTYVRDIVSTGRRIS
tara:strand:- start:271 stop:540 length:270 start_codon:yes stop_codon:yes gene_type:complete